MTMIAGPLRDWIVASHYSGGVPYEKLNDCYAKRTKTLDAAGVCYLIRRFPGAFGASSEEAKNSANELLKIRNLWAHQLPLHSADVVIASKSAASLFKLANDRNHADQATALRRADSPYSSELRSRLVKAARNPLRKKLTYSETLRLLRHDDTKKDRDWLYRMLTFIAAEQKVTGEPLLCSLVVLGPEDEETGVKRTELGLPGRGYYWLLGVDDRAPLQERKEAHKRELSRVFGFDWVD